MGEAEKLIELLMKANVSVNCANCGQRIELGRTFDCQVDLDPASNTAKFHHRDCSTK